jgi:hypothetical protein
MKIYLELIDLKTMKTFKKYFDTEFERDKFIRKLRYSNKISVIGKGEEYEDSRYRNLE